MLPISTPFWMTLMTLIRNADGGGGGGGNADGGDDGNADKGDGGANGNGNDNGGGNDPWYKSLNLEQDVAEHLAGKNYPDVATALKSGVQAERTMRDRNALPAFDPAKADDWEGWEKIGWSKDYQKYEVAKPKLPDGMPFNEAMFEEFRKNAHAARMPAGAAAKVYQGMVDHMAKLVGDIEAKGAKDAQDLDTALDAAWGKDKDRNSEIAKRAMLTFKVGADDAAELEALTGSPRLMQLFKDIGEKLGEANLVTASDSNGLPKSVDALRSELNRIQGDKEWMKVFRDARHPQNAEYVAQRQRLIDQIARAEAGRK